MKIMNIFRTLCPTSQKASVDEAYLDLTELVDQRMAKAQAAAEAEISSSSTTASDITANDRTQLVRSSRNALIQREYKWQGVVLGGEFEPETEPDYRLLVASTLVADIRKVQSRSSHSCIVDID